MPGGQAGRSTLHSSSRSVHNICEGTLRTQHSSFGGQSEYWACGSPAVQVSAKCILTIHSQYCTACGRAHRTSCDIAVETRWRVTPRACTFAYLHLPCTPAWQPHKTSPLFGGRPRHRDQTSAEYRDFPTDVPNQHTGTPRASGLAHPTLQHSHCNASRTTIAGRQH
jgi:hypothetical protein